MAESIWMYIKRKFLVSGWVGSITLHVNDGKVMKVGTNQIYKPEDMR